MNPDFKHITALEPDQQAEWACQEAGVILDVNVNTGGATLRNQIAAIKLYREATGCHLATAKRDIEIHVALSSIRAGVKLELAADLLARVAHSAGYQEAVEAHEAKLAEQKNTLAAVVNERNNARRELDHARTDYQQLSDAHDRLTRERNKLRDQHNMLTQDYHELRDRKNKIEDQLTERTTELAQLRDEHHTVALNYHQTTLPTAGVTDPKVKQALLMAETLLEYYMKRCETLADSLKDAESSMESLLQVVIGEDGLADLTVD